MISFSIQLWNGIGCRYRFGVTRFAPRYMAWWALFDDSRARVVSRRPSFAVSVFIPELRISYLSSYNTRTKKKNVEINKIKKKKTVYWLLLLLAGAQKTANNNKEKIDKTGDIDYRDFSFFLSTLVKDESLPKEIPTKLPIAIISSYPPPSSAWLSLDWACALSVHYNNRHPYMFFFFFLFKEKSEKRNKFTLVSEKIISKNMSEKWMKSKSV